MIAPPGTYWKLHDFRWITNMIRDYTPHRG